MGKNCMDTIFTRFPVLARLTARGPSLRAGRLRPPTIGARLYLQVQQNSRHPGKKSTVIPNLAIMTFSGLGNYVILGLDPGIL